MEHKLEKYYDCIMDAYKKEGLPEGNKFDLFAAIKEEANEEAFIYRSGYYIVNKYCNQNLELKVIDSFYTIYLNALLKFDVMKLGFDELFDRTDLYVSRWLLIRHALWACHLPSQGKAHAVCFSSTEKPLNISMFSVQGERKTCHESLPL